MIYETSITDPKKQLEFYKDLSEQLQQENKELKKQLEIKHNGFMASVEEACELAEENQKYKEVIDKTIEYISELDDNTDDTTCYDIDKVEKERLLQILDIDKGE